MDKDQKLGEGWVEAEDGKLDYKDYSDDGEVELLLPRKGVDERDPPGADIRNVLEALGTQQEDWFLMESLHGARPKWNRAGRPPVVPEEPRVLEAEATGGVVGRDIEECRAPAPPLLKPTGTRLRRLYNSADLLVTVVLTNATVA